MPKHLRNTLISAFTLLWLLVFQYESIRYHYLDPLFGKRLPKIKFLYPPAGWIMFFRVDDVEVRAEVYGQTGDRIELIDPHRIFETRWLGYDNLRRNILISTLGGGPDEDFCRYLRRKFPSYDSFAVAQAVYSCRPEAKNEVRRDLAYRC